MGDLDGVDILLRVTFDLTARVLNQPLLWIGLCIFAGSVGAASSELLERKRGLIVTGWACVAAAGFALALAAVRA